MKAISIRQPWASLIADGIKRVEVRSRQIHFRGDLLIVSTLRPNYPGLPTGCAIAVVEVYGCRPFTVADATDACLPYSPGLYVWLLRNPRPLPHPVRVRGQQGLYTVDLP